MDQSFYFAYDYLIVQALIAEKTDFSPQICLFIFAKSQLSIYLWAWFFTILFY